MSTWEDFQSQNVHVDMLQFVSGTTIATDCVHLEVRPLTRWVSYVAVSTRIN